MALIATKALKIRKLPFLTSDILEKLKCVDCGGYLSIPPIKKHAVFGSICGYCAEYNTDEGFVRNTEYEAIASLAEFPCKNSGCRKRFAFGEIANHEHTCVFRSYDCPFRLHKDCTCKWTGHVDELKNHFRETHAEFLLAEKNNFIPELRKNCEEIRLLVNGNDLFFVQTKCIVRAAKFWCLVRYVGQPEQSGLFRYTVETIGNRNNKVFSLTESTVQTDICLKMEQSVVIELDIDKMLSFLGSPTSVQCVIKITTSEDSSVKSDE